MVKILDKDDSVRFVQDTHQYFNKANEELKSVTKVIHSFEQKFDRESISRVIAKKMSEELKISIEVAQKRILDEWEAKRLSAEKRGNWIHGNLEKYALTGGCEPELSGVAKQLHEIIKDSYRYYPELLIYSMQHMIAGTSDLPVQRQKSKTPLIDIYDYKTNEANGIQYDSISRKNNELKHYNRYMLPPFDYLEQCNYITYSLQLSIYALMMQITWGVKIGRLAILYIDLNLKMHIIPVSYMRLEAEKMLEYQLGLKPLPSIKAVANYSLTPNQCFEKVEVNTDDDEW
jgi:hypothetical protein